MHSLRKSADDLMVQYAHYHRDRRNILTHLVGIPLIVFAIFLFLVWPVVTLGAVPITAAWVVWLVGAVACMAAVVTFVKSSTEQAFT